MSEIWVAAAVTVVGGVVAGKGQEKKDKSDKAHQAAMTEEESKLSAQRSGYERALEDFYTQKERQRKQRGLDQFRQFSTMGEFAPNYNIDAEARITPGEAPKYSSFSEEPVDAVDTQQGGSKKKSTLEKIDPLGAGLLKKLF